MRPRDSGAAFRALPGRARIVLSEDEFDRIEPGDVLVCSYSSPSWTFLFGVIGAVVADEGGLLSHAALLRRWHALPRHLE